MPIRIPMLPKVNVQKLKANTIITGFMPMCFSIIRGIRITSSKTLARINRPADMEKKNKKLCGFSMDNTTQPKAIGIKRR